MEVVFLFHIFTHVIIGACMSYLLLKKENQSLLHTGFQLAYGAFFGILPDLLGFRDSTPWSHSFILAPSVVVIPVFGAKLITKQYTFLKLWLSATLSVVLGHLLMDFFQHPITALYPFSSNEYEWKLIELGDPWIWFPLFLAVILLLTKKGRKYGVSVAILIVFAYLSIRSYYKIDITNEIEKKFRDSDKTIIEVMPLNHTHINVINPFDWLLWRYDVVGPQRRAIGYTSFSGDFHILNGIYGPTDYFFPQVGEVAWGPRNTLYRKTSMEEPEYKIMKDIRESDKRYLLCETNDGLIVYRYEDGLWVLSDTEQAGLIIEQYKSDQ